MAARRAHFGKYMPCSRRMYCAKSCFSRSVRSTVSVDEGAAISRKAMSVSVATPAQVIGMDGAQLPSLAFIIHGRPNWDHVFPRTDSSTNQR